MEELLAYIFISFIGDIVIWGMMYGTGCLLTPIISFGKLMPESALEEYPKGSNKWVRFGIIREAGEMYLGAYSVCLLGLSFWIAVITCLIIIF